MGKISTCPPSHYFLLWCPYFRMVWQRRKEHVAAVGLEKNRFQARHGY